MNPIVGFLLQRPFERPELRIKDFAPFVGRKNCDMQPAGTPVPNGFKSDSGKIDLQVYSDLRFAIGILLTGRSSHKWNIRQVQVDSRGRFDFSQNLPCAALLAGSGEANWI